MAKFPPDQYKNQYNVIANNSIKMGGNKHYH